MDTPDGGTPSYADYRISRHCTFVILFHAITDEMISDRFFSNGNRFFYSGRLQQKPHGERDYCVGSGNRDFFQNFFMHI